MEGKKHTMAMRKRWDGETAAINIDFLVYSFERQ